LRGFIVEFLLPDGSVLRFSESALIDEVRVRFPSLVREAGGAYDKLTGAWRVRVINVTPEILELAGIFGKDAVEELRRRYSRAVRRVKREAVRRKMLVVDAPDRVGSRGLQRRLSELRKYAALIRGRNSFVIMEDGLQRLLRDYGPKAYAFVAAVARAYEVKVYGLENLITVKKGSGEGRSP